MKPARRVSPYEHPALLAKDSLQITRRELRDAIVETQLAIASALGPEARAALGQIAEYLREALLFANFAHSDIRRVKGSRRPKPAKTDATPEVTQ